jgi:hypothetical protein
LAEYVHRNLLFFLPHLHSFHSHGEAEAGEERIHIELKEAYLGKRGTPSLERRDFTGGLHSILMPSFSVAITSTDVCSTANHSRLVHQIAQDLYRKGSKDFGEGKPREGRRA